MFVFAGWPDLKLKFDEIKWNELKNITVDCRVNILNVSVDDVGWFATEDNGAERIDDCVDGNVEEEEEEKKDDGDDEGQVNEEERANEEEFKKWLIEEVGLGQYFDAFTENEIRSLDEVVEYIEEKENLKEIGIKPFAHRAKLWRKIVALKKRKDDDEPAEF